MDPIQNPAPVVATAESGVSTTTLILGVVFVAALAAFGYYLIERKSTVPAINPNANVPIPGIEPQQNAGAKAVGVLTDPNFFNGLTGLAKTISDLVKENKANKKNSSDSEEDAPYKAPTTGYTGQSNIVLQGTTTSSNWGGWG